MSRRSPYTDALLWLRLKTGFELAVPGDCQLVQSLRVRELLCLQSLVQDLQLGLLVLKHAYLSRDARLQIQRGLLVPGCRDSVYQLLDCGEPTARIRETLLAYALQSCYGLALRLQLCAHWRCEQRQLPRG